MSKQNELRDLIQNYSCSCNVKQDMFVKHRNRFKHQIFDLFKKMAHKSVPKFVMEVNKGVEKVIKLTHKNIDKVFED